MRKTRLLSILFVLCILTLLVSACSLNSSSREIKTDPKETVIKAYQKLNSLNNYHMSMDVTTSMSVEGQTISSVVKGEMDIQQNPMLAKNTLNIVSEMDAKKTTQDVVQYIEEAGEQFNIYTKMNNQWVKQSLPKNAYNPLNEYDEYMKAITSVTVKREDAQATVFEVVANGEALQEQVQRKLSGVGMQGMNIPKDLFKDLGDLVYSVTIDKKTATVSKIEIDLSGFMAKIGNNMAESKDIPDGEKKIIKEMFGNMKTKSSVILSQFNSVGKITIPEEVKK